MISIGDKTWSRSLGNGFFLGLVVLLGLPPMHAQITEFPVLPFFPAGSLATGPDGALWYVAAGSIGRMTPTGGVTSFPVPTPNETSWSITAGPDGAMWFTETQLNSGAPIAKIGRITMAGAVTEYPLANQTTSYPTSIATGPDGALWFADNFQVGRITTSGAITEYPLPASENNSGGLWGIATGPDGALWLTEGSSNKIVRMTTDGVFTIYTLPNNASHPVVSPEGITAGPDGALWFAVESGFIGRITTAGAITVYPIPTASGSPFGIATGPDGAIWFTEQSTSVIGRITMAGTITETPTPTGAQGFFNYITAGPDGAMWFSEASKIGRIATSVTVTVTCSYALSSGGQAFPAGGGSATLGVTAPADCDWTLSGVPSWVTISGAPNGSGNGSVNYQVQANAGADRSATMTIASISYAIEQEAGSISGLNVIGSMAHLAAEENWTTAFTLVNKGAVASSTRLSFSGDALDPTGNGPLALPLAFPQQSGASGPLLAASFDRTLSANASLIVDSAGAQTPPVLVGSAQLAATGAVDGFAIFHQIVTTQEAVVPLETRNASSYLLAFDNTNGLVLGVAVENLSVQNAVIPVVIRDENGVVISTPGTTVSLGGNGHTSFVLSTQFTVTANLRGTIEFDTPSGGRISVLGLRFSPPNSALTTIPALANVGTGGGSIAHLASGGDGWQTTFVLVNTGTSSTSATLSFFNDQASANPGGPLTLPLAFPQSGGGASMTVPSYTTQLAAGATLIIVSSGAQSLLTGSAQLTTLGHVSGFVIFRHNDQEAVVPLESRNASGYIIAFDNTNGTATGIAVNAVSAGPVNVPVTVRDDTGATIATDTITLAANGHYAFTIGTDRYPAALTIRGTIEFDTPAGAQIGALGIRIPNVAAHTYTTLPALAK